MTLWMLQIWSADGLAYNNSMIATNGEFVNHTATSPISSIG